MSWGWAIIASVAAMTGVAFVVFQRRRKAERAEAALDTILAPLSLAPQAPGPALKPSLANTQISAATAHTRLPVLKLKYAGIRHRVSAEDGDILIGRESDANILIPSPQVSRHHATVIWDSQGYPLLVNLGKGGTSVHLEGAPAPVKVEGSFRFEGRGRIGLYENFAIAESCNVVLEYEAKWAP